MIKCQIFLILSICLTGCSDIFKGKEERIVGSISVINPDNEEDKGYKLVIYEKEYNSNILQEYVAGLEANDSIMVVKAIDKKDCNEVYYEIHHNAGKDPVTVLKIDYPVYNKLNSMYKWKYHFSDDSYVCP